MRMSRTGLAVLAIVCLRATTVSAQQPAPRLEVSVHATVLRLSDFGATNTGIGGRLTFDLTRWASIEGEANFIPNDDILLPDSFLADLRMAHSRRRADAFFGLKLGARGNRFGAFAKLRPGFARLTHQSQVCVGDDCARVLMLLIQPEYRTEFALDLGGGFEFYPSPRTVARIEMGDTLIRHRSTAPPCWGQQCTSHNFTSRLGVGFRF